MSPQADLSVFADFGKVSSWSEDALSWANAVGLIKGRDGNQLVPGANATRAEVATILQRFCEDLSKPSGSGDDPDNQEEQPEEQDLILRINDEKVSVVWEDNESVEALKKLAISEPLRISMTMYGGFEQVGKIGSVLPSDDVQTTTEAGDLVLYSSNQLVVFYGSNTWAYTRLGRITDRSASELAQLLGNGNVTISIALE